LDHSVIKIINGHHSGRTEGSPITDLALSMIEKINIGNEPPFRIYHSKSKYGKPVKSTTMVITGEHKKPIAMLCINLYLDSPIISFLQSISVDTNVEYATENFISHSDELITSALRDAKLQVNANKAIPASLKNKEIISLLSLQGVFKLKQAIKIVADDLAISTNTVYLHIRDIKKQERGSAS
jgi:predicted transcriptional regulator YheO